MAEERLFPGDVCEDQTGLAVQIDRIVNLNTGNRVYFSVMSDGGNERNSAGDGNMSYETFSARFRKIGHGPNHLIHKRKKEDGKAA